MSEVHTIDRAAIQSANAARKAATEAYMAQVQRQFPIGLEVQYLYGEKWIGPYEVIGHSDCWYQDPDYIHLRNIRTGKKRRGHPSFLRVYGSFEDREDIWVED